MSSGAQPRPLRVILVEDHALVRSAVRRALAAGGVDIVAEAGSAEEALDIVRDVHADVILVDIELPGMTGVQLVRELAPRLPDTKIIMLTGSARRDDLVAAMRNGAAGYLTKELSPDALVRAIEGVRQGDLPMPRRLAAELVQQLVRPSGGSKGDGGLSEREREVLRMISEGLTDREIAEALHISPRTVGRHVGNILAKLGARNRREAASRYREGI